MKVHSQQIRLDVIKRNTHAERQAFPVVLPHPL